MNLEGKTALVTGSAHRVGKAIARGFAERGANVAIHYHSSADAAASTAAEFETLGVQTITVQADLADPSAIEALFARIREVFGGLDVLVNSASTFILNDALDVSVEEWDTVMHVNLRAPFLCSQQAARLMMKTESEGVIVNIADIAGQVPWTRFPHHSVSKAGLIMLTRVLAKSFGPRIRVNAVVPGPVLKPGDMPAARWEQLGADLPLARTGAPENVTGAVLALVDNDFITGSVLNVDGGDALLGSVDFL